MLSLRGLFALVVVTALGYVALRVTLPADCEECSAEPEAWVLFGAIGLWLMVLAMTVVVALVLAWRWLRSALA
jgi:hypothetical protein